MATLTDKNYIITIITLIMLNKLISVSHHETITAQH